MDIVSKPDPPKPEVFDKSDPPLKQKLFDKTTMPVTLEELPVFPSDNGAISVVEALSLTSLEMGLVIEMTSKYNKILKKSFRECVDKSQNYVEIIEPGLVPKCVICKIVGDYQKKGWSVGWKPVEGNTFFHFNVCFYTE